MSTERRIAHREELKGAFADMLTKRLEDVPGMGAQIDMSVKPSVVMLVGVNGSGKTTTAAKLASMLKK